MRGPESIDELSHGNLAACRELDDGAEASAFESLIDPAIEGFPRDASGMGSGCWTAGYADGEYEPVDVAFELHVTVSFGPAFCARPCGNTTHEASYMSTHEGSPALSHKGYCVSSITLW
jgi:hypothetical protein